ncbi:MAG: protein tyrosine phosphatase [Propionibacteriaceae bacterium]|nr:protein tyrosine phosphatase [Propionibacteriaceae bacterium]
MSDQLSIVFVCTGNICRSPYAERRAASLSRIHRFASAGTRAVVGSPMDAFMAAEARERGADPRGFSSKQVSWDLLDAADLILTAESGQRSWLLSDWPRLRSRLLTVGHFASMLPEAPSGLDPRAVIQQVVGRREQVSAALDVPDPYLKGREAAHACADLLDELLGKIFLHLG